MTLEFYVERGQRSWDFKDSDLGAFGGKTAILGWLFHACSQP